MADQPINLMELEAIARDRMTASAFEYLAGGVTDEVTLRRTRGAYEAIALHPRVLPGASLPDVSVTALGQRIETPIMFSPLANFTRAHPDGELAVARAAAKAGTIMVLANNTGYPLEEVAAAADGPKWLQTYIFRDRELTAELIKRAEQSGYTAICLTLDAHWPSKREHPRDSLVERSRSRTAQAGHPPGQQADGPVRRERTRLLADPSSSYADPGATWADVEWVKSITKLPVVCKGILSGHDAAMCAQHGVDGLIVSNHGSKFLDTTLSTIEALPGVVAGADGKVEVYLDGGIRRGADVVKAIALGAQAVLLGRPVFWGLAYNGEAGLLEATDILLEEVEMVMMLCGRPSISDIDSTLIAPMPVQG